MDVLTYTFFAPNQITYKLLSLLNDNLTDKYYLGDINSLEKLIIAKNYKYVLGLGDYRKGTKTIKLETRFINRYGKGMIEPKGQPQYSSTWNLSLYKMKISTSPGNGPCNRSGYLLSNFISDTKLETRIAFMHIPSDFCLSEATETIEKVLLETKDPNTFHPKLN